MSMQYLPYIDNILIIWEGNKDDIKNVLHTMNRQHPTIKKSAKTFEGDPVISFRRTRNLGEEIGGNTIINNIIKRTAKENMNGKCRRCATADKKTMCCRQVKSTTSLTGYKNKRTFNPVWSMGEVRISLPHIENITTFERLMVLT